MRSRTVLISAVVIALVVAFLGWRTVESRRDAGDGSAGRRTTSASSSSSAVTGGSGDRGSKVTSFDPTTGPGALKAATGGAGPGDARAARMQLLTSLQTRPSIGFAIREAAASQERAANTFLGELVSFCLRNTTSTVKAQASASSYVPGRLRAPSVRDTPQMFRESADQMRFQENSKLIQDVCRDFDIKAAEAEVVATVEKLAAAGSAYAALLSEVSPRTNYAALTAEQFDLISRALGEQDIGTLALLGQQAQSMINAAMQGAVDSKVPEARYFGDTSGTLAWQLALCQLGAYCGADSVWAREACFKFGACGGEDLAAAIRAALIRDGLDATLIDKQAAAFVNAISSGDPTQLGMRRRKP
jgi:hypothetical protein